MARVEVITRPRHLVLARVADVPGFGWARCRRRAARRRARSRRPVRPGWPTARSKWSSTPPTAPGRSAAWPGYGRLVDDGDIGDTYNYNPPATDSVVDRPDSVSVDVLEAGPLRGRIAITSTYTWPERADADARVGARPVEVRTLLELRAGEDLLRVRHELDNPCADHRLRAWFPLPEPATTSVAESVFGTVERGLTAEGGPNEVGLPTFPSRRFVQAGGLTRRPRRPAGVRAGRRGPTGAPGQLALTLLRCTGLISQGPMSYRPVPAGPQIATDGRADAGPPGARVRARHLRSATRSPSPTTPSCRSSGPAPGAAIAGLAGLGTITPPIAAGAVDSSADRGTPLTVTGAEVSAVTRADGRVSVRVFNPSDAPTQVTIEGRHGWLVDLRGRTLEPFEGRFDLRPHGIATAVLDD